MTWPRRLTVLVSVLTAAALLGAISLFTAEPSARDALLLVAGLAVGIPPLIAGLLVTRRFPESAIGALLVVPGLVVALGILGALYSVVVDSTPPGADYLTAASQGDWVLVYVVVAVPLLFFSRWPSSDALRTLVVGPHPGRRGPVRDRRGHCPRPVSASGPELPARARHHARNAGRCADCDQLARAARLVGRLVRLSAAPLPCQR